MDIESIIREIKKRGLTGYKIAEYTGITQVGIDKILNGTTKKPTKKTISILENYLNNSYVTDLLHTTNEKGKPNEELKNTNTDRNSSTYNENDFLREQLKIKDEQILFYMEQINYFKKKAEESK